MASNNYGVVLGESLSADYINAFHDGTTAAVESTTDTGITSLAECCELCFSTQGCFQFQFAAGFGCQITATYGTPFFANPNCPLGTIGLVGSPGTSNGVGPCGYAELT